MRILWSEIDPHRYEDMVAVLLSRLHPDSQRIDGSGGDRGRDVQIVGEDREVTNAFQLKSFTGRMTSGRRTQVARSLRRAASLKPRKWSLVVPIDPTPGEEEWFATLSDEYPFPTRWLGKTWLDEKMAVNPDIPRYFIEGAADEVVQLLIELRDEQALVTSVSDAVARFEKLRSRLNEIDPHYRYEISTGEAAMAARPAGSILSTSFENIRVDIFERYRGALSDRPIAGSMRFIFREEDGAIMGEIQRALDYGYPVSIPSQVVEGVNLDAPGGLGGSLTDVEIDVRPANPAMDDPIPFWFDIVDGERLLASWRVDMTERSEGFRGVVLSGQDQTKWLTVRLEFDVPSKRCRHTLTISPEPVLPAALVPLLRWARLCMPPNDLVIRSEGGLEMREPIPAALLDAGVPRVVEALAYLQERSNVTFPMPLDLSPEDEGAILDAAALVQGESVTFTWTTFTLDLKRWVPEFDALLAGNPQFFQLERDESIQLSEGTIPIGRVRTRMGPAVLSDVEAVRDALAAGVLSQVRLVPGESNTGLRDLVD